MHFIIMGMEKTRLAHILQCITLFLGTSARKFIANLYETREKDCIMQRHNRMKNTFVGLLEINFVEIHLQCKMEMELFNYI